MEDDLNEWGWERSKLPGVNHFDIGGGGILLCKLTNMLARTSKKISTNWGWVGPSSISVRDKFSLVVGTEELYAIIDYQLYEDLYEHLNKNLDELNEHFYE